MISALMNYFRPGRASKRRSPSGNRAAPPHIQQEIIAAARAKRERKLDRSHGWYNG